MCPAHLRYKKDDAAAPPIMDGSGRDGNDPFVTRHLDESFRDLMDGADTIMSVMLNLEKHGKLDNEVVEMVGSLVKELDECHRMMECIDQHMKKTE